ncbi:MAG: ABC transporter substrate-binding protein [Rickettsiaceae bacterium]|nr:ABC transporter substrate-binding protein [Rickettsiaceae bacterium]MDP4832604.1 ABC transporter substrate-binding protein [Rickettsiaceae bacterium]MDP5021157.1 ABC transporter substrate-binding protein [Rickettsiaceae bacterium]MDP5083398.1 ABC transporter substrate-binding protein [Rickettsiaceae bacterium]
MFRNIIWLVAIGIASLLLQSNVPIEGKKVKIYINQLVEHPALDATTRGIVEGLTEAGYIKDHNLDLKIESAQGNVSLAGQIANKFVSNEPDIVVGVGTVAAQSFVKYLRDSKAKLIFTTITDPIGANLVSSLEHPGSNISGVSNFVPLEPQIEMFKRVKPRIKKLGFLYNPGEMNSISLIEKLRKVCPKYGIELVVMPASKSSEVAQSAIKLSSSVDAIFISNDNTALSALRVIVKAANAQKIPVFVSDTDIVVDGAIAALGPNQYDIGRQTAAMIIRIIKGENISEVAVDFPRKTELVLNAKVAEKLGIILSAELISEAKLVITY